MKNMNLYRTHNCNELKKDHIGQSIRISGWIHSKRDHGNLLFIDLRDQYGITQCVIESNSKMFAVLNDLRNESVVTVHGEVIARAKETVNENINTGEIEIEIRNLEVLSRAELLPILVNTDQDVSENLRLQYRFLDLRRENMQRNIKLRSDVIADIRRIMSDSGFQEFQTPILTASSPEGARDYLVPSRLNKGKFYALPQAPQQFKQLLMASGFDKYFQIAPCFRDEDARADRSPGEFYQLDIEMSFVTQEDIFAIVESLLYDIFSKYTNKKIANNTFPRITYQEAIEKYGSDKPDLRNPIILQNVTHIFKNSGFSIFAKAVAQGKQVIAISAPKTSGNSRSFFDKNIEYAKQNLNAGGLAYIVYDQGIGKGPIAKLLTEDELSNIKSICNLQDGDSVFFACDTRDMAYEIAGGMRKHLANGLNLIDNDIFEFCWIVDFPYYEWNEEKQHIDFSHNPFSMPQGGYEAITKSADPEYLLSLKAYQYDIVCNGIELSSGAIRNHDPVLMYKAFEIAGYSQQDVDDKFSALIKAFKFGVPPHGGIAPGIDRMIMLLTGEPNIREVIAFPMNQMGQDLLMNAPSEVSSQALKDLGLKLDAQKK